MPVIKSAQKKVRKDKKRTRLNRTRSKVLSKTLKAGGNISKLYSTIDKAAKKKIIHKNKARRLKSRLSKLLGKKKKSSK